MGGSLLGMMVTGAPSRVRGVVLCLAATLSLCQGLVCGPYATTSLRRKDTSVVCIEYANNCPAAQKSYTATSYVAFHPKVDVFSSFELDAASLGPYGATVH